MRSYMKAELRNPPPTYNAVIKWVKEHKGYTVKTCWIADVKKQMGYNVKPAHNRKGIDRVEPCPRSLINEDICEALKKA
jgi:hypothetical protein